MKIIIICLNKRYLDNAVNKSIKALPDKAHGGDVEEQVLVEARRPWVCVRATDADVSGRVLVTIFGLQATNYLKCNTKEVENSKLLN